MVEFLLLTWLIGLLLAAAAALLRTVQLRTAPRLRTAFSRRGSSH